MVVTKVCCVGLSILLSSCGLVGISTSRPSPPGKILFQDKNQWFVHDSSAPKDKQIFFRSESPLNPSSIHWMHQGDGITGDVYLKHKRRHLHAEIDAFDTSGKLQRVLYRTDSTSSIGSSFLSWDDSKAVFVLWKLSTQVLGVFKTLPKGSTRTIVVLDVNTGKIIDTVRNSENVGWLKDSPWVSGDSKFIYTTITPEEIKKGEKEKTTIRLFIYDLERHESRQIEDNIYYASCSPSSRSIAYSRGNELWILDLDTNTDRLLYKARYDIDFQWSPDGNNILLSHAGGQKDHSMKLINVSSGRETDVFYFYYGIEAWK